MNRKTLKIGSRKSQLALYQADMFKDAILAKFPEISIDIVPINTTGDKIKNKPLYEVGGKALFIKELEESLIEGAIDIAVHSLKDVPGRLLPGLKIAAMLEGEDKRDVLISRTAENIATLPKGGVVHSASPRRQALIKKMRPDVEVAPLRGNITSRLDKFYNGEIDNMVLAFAGLKRLNLWDDKYMNIIPISEMLPACGQGVIAAEILESNEFAYEICRQVNALMTWELTMPERGFLYQLDADCKTPIASWVERREGKIFAKFMLSQEGNMVFHEEEGELEQGWEIGVRAAVDCLHKLKPQQ